MKLSAQVKLLPSHEQIDSLLGTLGQANRACQFVSNVAWNTRTFRQFDLHKRCYREIRSRFGLSAQVAVRVIAKVADAYKLDHRTRRRFSPLGAIAFDDRILSWNMHERTISIWTTAGRLHIPFTCGPKQEELLRTRQGESRLALFCKRFFLYAACEIQEVELRPAGRALGVDLGVVNIAVDSEGEIHCGGHINHIRHRQRRLRAKLQARGTRSAKRKLKYLSGKERRFAKDVNHCISKQLVAKAQGTNRAIALEDLQGIRSRVTVGRSRRATLYSWSFHQLRRLTEYKARRAGVPFLLVDPTNTSRTCPACGHVSGANRPIQSLFPCVACGFTGHADHVAAVNIGRRADVNQPIVAHCEMVPNAVLVHGAVTSRML
jgi:putative transposase